MNDLSKSIYSFWQVVLEDTDNICRLINDTPVDICTWFKQREVQAHPKNTQHWSLAFPHSF